MGYSSLACFKLISISIWKKDERYISSNVGSKAAKVLNPLQFHTSGSSACFWSCAVLRMSTGLSFSGSLSASSLQGQLRTTNLTGSSFWFIECCLKILRIQEGQGFVYLWQQVRVLEHPYLTSLVFHKSTNQALNFWVFCRQTDCMKWEIGSCGGEFDCLQNSSNLT